MRDILADFISGITPTIPNVSGCPPLGQGFRYALFFVSVPGTKVPGAREQNKTPRKEG